MRTKLILLMVLFIFVNLNYAQNVNNGLIAYYPFHGNAHDESGNGHNGTVTGAVLASDRSGISNEAYYFDGLGDKITINDSNSLEGMNAISIAAWVKVVQLPPSGKAAGIVSKWGPGTSGDDSYNLRIYDNGKIEFEVKPGGSSFISVTQINVNSWYHLCGVWDGNQSKIYINGNLDKSINLQFASIQNTSQDLLIGQDGNGTTLKGYIDDVRIYNRALTESEIDILYQGTSITGLTIDDIDVSESHTEGNSE